MNIEHQIRSEVADLHAFFTAWLAGTTAHERSVFARLTQVLDPSFALVTPSGIENPRDALVESLYAAWGKRPRLRIWVENSQLIAHRGDVAIARYDECQDENGVVSRRLSTAVFIVDAACPFGVRWLRVHETWAPTAGDE